MYPTPFQVDHHARTVTGTNAVGQPLVESSTATRRVYGWRRISERDGSSAALQDRTISELYLLMPDQDWSDGDRVSIPGRGDWEVVGEVEDFTTGPFGGIPGCYRVRLRQVRQGPPQ